MAKPKFAPEDATAYMNGSKHAADSVGPGFDPEQLLAARRAGATTGDLSDRVWAFQTEQPNPLGVLLGG